MAGRRKLYLSVEDPIGNQQAAEKDAGRAQICVCLPSLSTVFPHFQIFPHFLKVTKWERKEHTFEGKIQLMSNYLRYFLKFIKPSKIKKCLQFSPYFYCWGQYLQIYSFSWISFICCSLIFFEGNSRLQAITKHSYIFCLQFSIWLL